MAVLVSHCVWLADGHVPAVAGAAATCLVLWLLMAGRMAGAAVIQSSGLVVIMAHPAIAFGAWLGFSCRAGIRSMSGWQVVDVVSGNHLSLHGRGGGGGSISCVCVRTC